MTLLDWTAGPPGHRAVGRRSTHAPRARENVPLALAVLPQRIRRHLLALDAYARFVGELGDHPATADGPGMAGAPTDRTATLRRLEAELYGLYDGRAPTHPALAGLAPTVAACGLPIEPLLRLIAANRVDRVVVRHASFAGLVECCHLCADPVGELVLHVFGVATPERIALSDRICTALRLVEHLRDVGEDRRRGRVHLPTEDLARFGVTERDLDAPRARAPLRNVIRLEASRAATWLDAGAPLVATLRGWARLTVAAQVAGGRAALAALARSGYDPLPGPPRPTRSGITRHWLTSLVGSAG
ncbi:squalene/phytoene synthase family protein [Micromonospora sp. NPDC049679]|uniref:squalene/phytoene synthase family protein n=1 Tax=Micromonospora sp. NPDC049679 TaxID=3155920 RepID=UPI0033DC537E